MPITEQFRLETIVNQISQKIIKYNNMSNGPRYNYSYRLFIEARDRGINENGYINKWLGTEEASTIIYNLLDEFGMNSRKSSLTNINIFYKNIKYLNNLCNLSELSNFPIESYTINKPLGNSNVIDQITNLFNFSSKPKIFSDSGGFVIASKVAHCIIPELLPMIDISHIGISLYNIHKDDYLPPTGDWIQYLGYKPKNKLNPSPRGAGRNYWNIDQYLCAIGLYARIYNIWQKIKNNPGKKDFLSLDPLDGATGIPRVLDKVFW